MIEPIDPREYSTDPNINRDTKLLRKVNELIDLVNTQQDELEKLRGHYHPLEGQRGFGSDDKPLGLDK